MYRIYSEDKSKHYSAICLSDGNVLEVKNPDTNKKLKFSSLNEWCAYHSVDESAIVGETYLTPEKTGFDCPKEDIESTHWLIWCYNIIAEGAPHLLERDDVREAYNAFVKICKKHSDILQFSECDDKYSPYRLQYDPNKYHYWLFRKATPDKWFGFCACFKNEFSLSTTIAPMKYPKNIIDMYRTEILTSYKKLYDLIHLELVDFMKKRDFEVKTQKEIKLLNKIIKTQTQKVKELEDNLEYTKNYLERAKQDLEKVKSGNVIFD